MTGLNRQFSGHSGKLFARGGQQPCSPGIRALKQGGTAGRAYQGLTEYIRFLELRPPVGNARLGTLLVLPWYYPWYTTLGTT